MKSEILIVGKTKMNNGQCCVGGITLPEKRLVRLMNRGNNNQPEDTAFEIGNIWEINYINRNPVTPPHVEDIIVLEHKFLRHEDNMSTYLESLNLDTWIGGANKLFDDKLGWTNKNNRGYIAKGSSLPSQSVGFWKSDKDLTYNDMTGCYVYPGKLKIMNLILGQKEMKYKGFREAVKVIPAGTLIRVSLSRFLQSDISDIEDRCYLQLSGWYD